MRPQADPLTATAPHSPGAQASVVVAVVIFSIRPDSVGQPRLQVLLVRRAVEPFAGSWSLPGGKLWGDEALDEAAWRQLLEKSALRASYLEQLYTFELRDASRQIEAAVVAYYALVRTDGTEIAPGRKTMEAAWFPVDELPPELAFDNGEILHYALQRLRNKVEYALVAFQFLPPLFTMAQSCAPSTKSSLDARSTPQTSAGASKRPAAFSPRATPSRAADTALRRCTAAPATRPAWSRPCARAARSGPCPSRPAGPRALPKTTQS